MKQNRGDWVCKYCWFFLIFYFFFKENHIFTEAGENLSENVNTVEEELEGTDIDDIGNVENLLRLVFSDKEWKNPKVVVDR